MKGWAWHRVSIRVSHPAAPGSILIASQICLNVAEIYRRHYLECKQLTDVVLVQCLNYKKNTVRNTNHSKYQTSTSTNVFKCQKPNIDQVE